MSLAIRLIIFVAFLVCPLVSVAQYRQPYNPYGQQQQQQYGGQYLTPQQQQQLLLQQRQMQWQQQQQLLRQQQQQQQLLQQRQGYGQTGNRRRTADSTPSSVPKMSADGKSVIAPVRSVPGSRIVQPKIRENAPKFPRASGEYENQKALMISVSDWQDHHFHIFEDIVNATAGHTPLLVLFNDAAQLKKTIDELSEWGEDIPHVYFLQLPLDTVWLRDFGPRFVETEAGCAAIDMLYEGQRKQDDRFPQSWSKLSNTPVKTQRWTLQGGNLLTNGNGVAIASTRIFDDNYISFDSSVSPPGEDPMVERQRMVTDAFIDVFNLKQFVILEPLMYEQTRHVDMFATFLDKDLIVIAQVDPREDPVNARILDRNAERMKKVMVDGKPMRVARVPIPRRQGKVWSPYTNVIVANDVLLMPIYNTDPPAVRKKARDTYRQLLPNHAIKTIDMSTMMQLEGSLHCMSMGLPDYATMPKSAITYKDALRYIYKVETLEERQKIVLNSYLREFKTAGNDFAVKAYPTGMDEKYLYLVRADTRKQVKVKLNLLSAEDRNWLFKKEKLIEKYGRKVRDMTVAKSTQPVSTSQ